MDRVTIRFILISGTFCLICILCTQAYWVLKSYELKEREFDLTVKIALKNVAQNILKYNENTSPLVDPVVQLKGNYFVVKVNDKIEPSLLEGLLKGEFLKEELKTDLQYTIYDCVSKNKAVGWVRFSERKTEELTFAPHWKYNNYFFSVYFPDKEFHLLEEMKLWMFFTLLLLVIVTFFSYVLFVVFRQKQLSEMQRDFVNNMTHEFRTPLSTILLSSRALKDSQIVDHPQRLLQYSSIIETEASRLSHHVERVLQMAKEETGGIPLKWESIDLHVIILKAVEVIKTSFPAKNILFDLKLNASDVQIMGDELHLLTLFCNLLDNAVKYCPIDPCITITTQNTKKGIDVFLMDNGVGIAMEHQKRIFEKF